MSVAGFTRIEALLPADRCTCIETPHLMARINDVYLQDPCSNSLMVEYLNKAGIPISCDMVRNLMRNNGYG